MLQEEQDLGFALMQMLSTDQQSKAMLGNKKPENMEAGFAQDNLVLEYDGIPASEMMDDQKAALLAVIGEYVGNIREGHANARMEEISEHLDETYFGWRGEFLKDSVFYYRIHSPVVLIEFDHQRTIAAGPMDEVPTRNHIHTMLRSPNGGDYGRDLLAEHLEKHH